MITKPSPLAFLAFLIAGWISRQQLTVIEYLKAENRLLRERLEGRSLRFSDEERALFARKAFGIPRKVVGPREHLEELRGERKGALDAAVVAAQGACADIIRPSTTRA